MPIHKWTLALVALMPMSVYLAASLSADAMTLGLSLLVFAVTLNLALGSEGPSRRGLLALGFLLVLLALSKQAYLGLALLFFMIPGKRFSSPATRWLLAVLMIGVPLAIDAAWTYSLRGLYVPMLPRTDTLRRPAGPSPLDPWPSLELCGRWWSRRFIGNIDYLS